MNVAFAPALEKFAIGQPVSRKEDPMLLRGEGRYTDDLNLPGQLHAVIVRSRHAHGILGTVDTEAARVMPGVHAILTASDLRAAGINAMPASAAKHANGGTGENAGHVRFHNADFRLISDSV